MRSKFWSDSLRELLVRLKCYPTLNRCEVHTYLPMCIIVQFFVYILVSVLIFLHLRLVVIITYIILGGIGEFYIKFR